MPARFSTPFATAVALLVASIGPLTAQSARTDAIAIPGPSAPAPQPAKSGPFLGFALDATIEFGGDDFLEVFFTDGTSQQIKAGQGGTLSIGGLLRPSDASPLSLRGTLGIKYVTTAADNANIRFTRIPIELVGSYDFPNGMRAGAGLVSHVNNSFNGDGFVPDASFGAATGFTAEVGYKAIALTYTALDYTTSGGQSFNGGSIGVQLLWTPKGKAK